MIECSRMDADTAPYFLAGANPSPAKQTNSTHYVLDLLEQVALKCYGYLHSKNSWMNDYH